MPAIARCNISIWSRVPCDDPTAPSSAQVSFPSACARAPPSAALFSVCSRWCTYRCPPWPPWYTHGSRRRASLARSGSTSRIWDAAMRCPRIRSHARSASCLAGRCWRRLNWRRGRRALRAPLRHHVADRMSTPVRRPQDRAAEHLRHSRDRVPAARGAPFTLIHRPLAP